MARRRRESGMMKRYMTVTVPLDEELAAHLDRAAIAFGLESRQQMATMAVRAWLAASLENETIHQAVQLALKQAREHEFAALAAYYRDRAAQFGAFDVNAAQRLAEIVRGERTGEESE